MMVIVQGIIGNVIGKWAYLKKKIQLKHWAHKILSTSKSYRFCFSNELIF